MGPTSAGGQCPFLIDKIPTRHVVIWSSPIADPAGVFPAVGEVGTGLRFLQCLR